jgi:hypothetical protein
LGRTRVLQFDAQIVNESSGEYLGHESLDARWMISVSAVSAGGTRAS